MNKYEVYNNFVKVGPFYTIWCGFGIHCGDCEFDKRYPLPKGVEKCPYNAMAHEMFGRTYMENWNEVQKLIQTLFEEGV